MGSEKGLAIQMASLKKNKGWEKLCNFVRKEKKNIAWNWRKLFKWSLWFGKICGKILEAIKKEGNLIVKIQDQGKNA